MTPIESFEARALQACKAINDIIHSRLPVEMWHPGEFLGEEIEARGLTHRQVAAASGIPPGRISELVSGKRDVTAAISVRLGHAFTVGDNFFLALQGAYDLWLARKALQQKIAKLERLPL